MQFVGDLRYICLLDAITTVLVVQTILVDVDFAVVTERCC